jgi:Na+/pantothenate symporter
VGGGIGFLGQKFVFTELIFPRRKSTCYELFVASLYLLFNFVQSASIKYLGVIALLWADLCARYDSGVVRQRDSLGFSVLSFSALILFVPN